ncbi:MAG: MBL fold metallo-hydrolase [Actinomycetota bacterium]
MELHLCGVRGSTPAVGEDFAEVGGHTSCVAIAHDGAEHPTLVLDAGTGLRRLSKNMGTTPFTGTLVVGHLHWDHMMGIPFFPAGDRPGARVQLLIPEQGVAPEQLIERMMSPPFFPIGTGQLRGDWSFGTYGEDTFEVEGFTVTAREIPHKGGRTMGLRVSDGRSTIAYLSDHAPTDLGPGDDGLGAVHPAAVELARGADVLVHDAQYTSTELPGRITWGHCAADYAVTLGAACGVRTVLLFHHDPNRTDDQVAALRGNLVVPDGLQVEVAVEGAVIRV